MLAEEIAKEYFMMSAKQRLNFVMYLTSVPALTLHIFLRRKLGFRFLNPNKFVTMGALLSFLSLFSTKIPTYGIIATKESTNLIVVFSAVMVLLGVWQRRARWQELKNGIFWHSYSEGISILCGIMPKISQDTVNRFVDPIASMMVGFLLISGGESFLGKYIVLAGFCLFHYEQALNNLRIEEMLDKMDGICDAEAHSKEIEYFSQPNINPLTDHLTIEESLGIPTGIAPDIQAHIKRRQSRQLPPDNLAG